MADLLEERSSNKVVLTYVGMDILGSFVTKDGRKEFKKYGAIFTYFPSWDIHLDVMHSTDTNSFIMCLRIYIRYFENVRMLKSGNASDFIGAEKELNKGFLEMDHS